MPPQFWRSRDWTFLDDDTGEILEPEERLLRHTLVQQKTEGISYAWGRTARLVCQNDFVRSYLNTKGDFVSLDLCSAFPMWPQILRELHRDNCFTHSVEIVDEFMEEMSSEAGQTSWIAELDPKFKKNFLKTFSRPRIRNTLHIAIQDTLYSPPNVDDKSDAQNIEQELANIFLYRFKNRVVTRERSYHKDFPGEKIREITKWRTFEEEVKLLRGEKEADLFIQNLATWVAPRCLPYLRNFRALSLDVEDHHKLLRDAGKFFSQAVKDFSNFFGQTASFRDHFRADALRPPFAPNSISFISSIEGYPWLFSDIPLDWDTGKSNDPGSHLNFADYIKDTLKPGGRAVFFPWTTRENKPNDASILKFVARYWSFVGMNVYRRKYDSGKLLEGMGDRERVLAAMSPLFTDFKDELYALIVEKPKEA